MLAIYEEEQSICYKILTKAINQNKISHAYLFETNGYINYLDFIKTFAKMILCTNEKRKSKDCNLCNQCKLIDENNFPELKIIEPDGSWIKKEQLIDLQEEFKKKPLIGNKKVYIITQAERLNIISSNSILKFLEEPQEGIIAILVTNNRFQLLDTIISRCQLLSFKGNEYTNDTKNLTIIEKLGQALFKNLDDYNYFLENKNLLDQLESIIRFMEMFEQYKQKTILYTTKYIHSVFFDKQEINWAIKTLCYLYQDILNIKINRKLIIFEEYAQRLQKIAEINDVSDIIRKVRLIDECLTNLDYNSNINLTIDKLIIDMAGR